MTLIKIIAPILIGIVVCTALPEKNATTEAQPLITKEKACQPMPATCGTKSEAKSSEEESSASATDHLFWLPKTEKACAPKSEEKPSCKPADKQKCKPISS